MDFRVLGFDVSSTTIGWALIESKDNERFVSLVDMGHIKPIKTGSIIERLADTKEKVKAIIDQQKPTHIAIEEIVQFMQGGSTAKTIITLTAFNRMIGLLAYDCLGQVPEMLSVMAIRHGLKTGKTLPSKEDMPKLVCKHLKTKFKPIMSKNGKIKSETYDQYDAVAVALFCIRRMNGSI